MVSGPDSAVRASPIGLIAVEAQLISIAQRHLQLRFKKVQSRQGDGWVQFTFPALDDPNALPYEVQQLCCALVRDEAGGNTTVRLAGEMKDSNFSNIADASIPFVDFLGASGDVAEQPCVIDDLACPTSSSTAICRMLDMLYQDVARDIPQGVLAVRDFPPSLCAMGTRFDVLLKNTICIKAFSATTHDPVSLSDDKAGGLAGENKIQDTHNTDLGDDVNMANENGIYMENSISKSTLSMVTLPSGLVGMIWIDTAAFSQALALFSHSASIESELPPLWRSRTFDLAERHEIIQQVYAVVKNYWCALSPSQRTDRTKINALALLSIVSADLREYVKAQIALSAADWRGPWLMDRVDLHEVLELCKEWKRIVERLLKKDWDNWDGGFFHDESLDKLLHRLVQAVRIRDELEQAAQILDSKSLPNDVLPQTLFENVDLMDLRQDNVRWDACVASYDREMGFLEPKLCNKIRTFFAAQNTSSCMDNQIRRLTQLDALLRRSFIYKTFEKNISEIPQCFTQHIDSAQSRCEDALRKPISELTQLRVIRKFQVECCRVADQAYELFNYRSGSASHQKAIIERCRVAMDAVKNQEGEAIMYLRDVLEKMAKVIVRNDIAVTIEMVYGESAEPQEGPTAQGRHYLQCLVHPFVHQFLLEAATFQTYAVGTSPPTPTRLYTKRRGEHPRARHELSEEAHNIIQAAAQLNTAAMRMQQSIANFNTVLQQMIPSTRAILRPFIERTLSQVLYADSKRRVIPFVNYQELEGLSLSFQNLTENLSKDNCHIRRFHSKFASQVMALQNVDLISHMSQWRSAVDSMRGAFDEFLSQRYYKDYDAWRRHWDCQIYKSLEYQYRLGLERLHEAMEEFKVELVFKQGLVQFKPSFEAIREAYYIKLREFVGVPLRFRGLQQKREGKGDHYEIYPAIPIQNYAQIVTVHTKAIEVFARLNRIRRAFRVYVMLGLCGMNGAPDLDSIVEQWCVGRRAAESTGGDPSPSGEPSGPNGFLEGIQTLKEYRAKLAKIENTIKVDCFTISTIPVKVSIDGQFHRLEESLLNFLRRCVQNSLKDIDEFVFSASNVIERQPTTMDEVGQANKAYRGYLSQLAGFEAMLKETEEQNKILRQHSGTSIDLSATKTRWEHLREAMVSHTKVIEVSVSKMRVSLDALIQRFLKSVQRFSVNWGRQKTALLQAFKDRKMDNIGKLIGDFKDQIKDFEDLKVQAAELSAKCEYFNLPQPSFTQLAQNENDVNRISAAWSLYDRFEAKLDCLRSEDWLTFRSNTYHFEDFCTEWDTTINAHLQENLDHDNTIAEYLQALLIDWKSLIPLLKVVRGDGWMAEHWSQVFRLLDIPKGITSTTLTFGDLLSRTKVILEKEDELKQLHARALGEIQLREALQDLQTWALEATFKLIVPTNLCAKVKLISEWKEVMTEVSDNQALISSLKDSPFFVHFADNVNAWETKLSILSDSLTFLNKIQRKWVYLEPIFARGALPQEQSRFKRLNKEFVAILQDVEADPRVMNIVTQTDLNDRLKIILEQIERCQKSLMEYLEAKRDKIPRLYFISDEDLLEILGDSHNPFVIQAHLKKLFMGINLVGFNSDRTAITHMLSADGERVELLLPVSIADGTSAEDWLISLDAMMKKTLHEQLVRCVQEGVSLAVLEVIQRYPSQVLQVAQQIIFSRAVEKAIETDTLKKIEASQQKELEQLIAISVKGDNGGKGVTQLKIKALILDAIKNLQILELLIAKKIHRVNNWHWQKQLRYSMTSKQQCWVHMADATFEYTYEYQGNAPKLVYTPLTDKCYLVLTKGMNLGYGGNPYGPAGTGKTESVKALGSAMGRQVLVFNCDEGIDCKAMGRILMGIAKCGAWGCFDEFNRLKIDQLSAISQMIQGIQETLKNKEPTCSLSGRQVEVSPHTGVFVTLNPAGKGYGGRTKLPDNLKQLFREVAMSVPDSKLIACTMLLSEGFKQAQLIANNVVELYKLCGQLLSWQQHYDWGLRALKVVLQYGGTLMQRWRRERPQQTPTQAEELELIVQSININTLSKLTLQDTSLFSRLMKDIFTGVASKEATHEELEKAIVAAIAALGLQPNASQARKALQLYEAMKQRMGVVLVGSSGTGKSTVLRILNKALEKMDIPVLMHQINPKAMPRHQFLGYMDADTREWYDGVLTVAAKDVARQPKEALAWVICDGDIDPLWIESLNSVLDDNRLLTMPNGVRVHFGDNVNFLFETDSLKYASPATVSRMGVLFFSEKDIELEGIFRSEISKQPGNTRQRILPLINKYATRAIEKVVGLDDLAVPTTPVGLITAVLNHVLDAENETDFVYAMIRALGSVMNKTGATELANWLYAESGQKPVSSSRPLDTYWDRASGTSMEFHADPSLENNTLSTSSTLERFVSGDGLVVQTVEMHRVKTTLEPLLRGQECRPIFLVGPEGCGKGCILKHCLQSYAGVRTITINCSAQTTSAVLIQKLEQLCSMHSTVKGRVLQPKDGEHLVIVLKNIDLPKPDRYGTVELHAFLQQLISKNGFYSGELEWIGTKQLQVVATMTPNRASSGYTVTPRLLAMVNIVSISYPSKKSLFQIYSTYWSALLRATNISQGKDYNDGHDLAQFVTSTYEKICAWFDSKDYAHIHFSPRHLTRWVANVLMYKIDTNATLPAVLAYEARRIFVDPLPSLEDRAAADRILSERLATIGYSMPNKEDSFAFMYVTWFSQKAAATAEAGEPDGDGDAAKQQSRPRTNRRLECHQYKAIADEISAALLRYGREFKDLTMTVIPPVVSWVVCVDRVLSRPAGHLIVVGRPGVGRRDTIALASYLQQMEVVTLHITQDYTIKNFRADIRTFIQNAVVQNTRITLIVEEHQIVDETFLELLNSLVSSGEVPGLFTAEEMEIMYTPLREDAASDGYIGPIASYFVDRLQRNLHVAFILDPCHEMFLLRLKSNPGFIRTCELLWMGTWSAETTKTMCRTQMKDQIALLEADPAQKGFRLHREMFFIHDSVPNATPKDFEVLMKTYTKIMVNKSKSSDENIIRLDAGLVKLKDAEDKVASIKEDVSAKKSAVEAMQKEADEALNQIQNNIQNSQEQRDQASELREQLSEEQNSIELNRRKSEEELGSIKPLMEAARDAVSSIRTEQLNEMRSLKAPPEPIRDVLEGVLALLGVSDVSWQSMRNFLAERGVKERIVDFDIKKVTPQIRANVASLLKQKANSFKPEVIQRASLAAAPMADWVKALVEYTKIMDRISPLTRQIEVLEQNQREGEQKLHSLEEKLKRIDKSVDHLRENFSKKCKEAERLREKLKTAEEQLGKAEELLGKLSDEKTRWAQDVASLRVATESMPKRALISAAFMTYLPQATEEVRQRYLMKWAMRLRLIDSDKADEAAAVDLRCINFLRTEGEILQYKSEGLPSDELSLENAVAMLEATQTPLVIDPTNTVLEWTKTHLRQSNVIVEVASLHDKRFAHTLELAVRFGKTLLVTEVNTVEPILYPILRQDLTSSGAKRIVRIGNKTVDWQDAFRIILFSRSTDLHLPPCAAALVMEVNFSVTARSLESQLLSITLQNERPELESQKVELLKKEEGLKMEITKLESQLLRELTDSQGNFMENTQLVTSLNTVKAQSSVIQQALTESHALQAELDEKREIYRLFASKGSQIFFLLKCMERLNRMYQFGLNDFLRLFSETLQKDSMTEDAGMEEKNKATRTTVLVQSLARRVFYRVCTGLLKKDRLVFGLELLQILLPEQFPANQWDALVGRAPKVIREESAPPPKWVPLAVKPRYSALLSSDAGHELAAKWHFHDEARWSCWMASEQPELFEAMEGPSQEVEALSLAEKLLLVSTFRPDRFSALGLRVIMQGLHVSSLVPPMSLEETILCSSSARVPVLLVTSSGADPSVEVQNIAIRRMGKERFIQVALGGGVTEEAMQQLRSCAAQGGWIFLKNLHLVLDWASALENELCAMPEPHKDFRLIITTEPHEAFPSVLLQMSLKITIEAPPGVKQNLLRTYQLWDRVFLEAQSTPKAQAFFALAWLHAVVQERRTFVPQGWTSCYEFSTADLKAATDILLQLDIQRETNWESLKGFLMDCVYGGRLDNLHDIEVLRELIQVFFSNEVVAQCKAPLYGDLTVPNTNNHDAVVSLLARKLPNVDQPALLKLPDNADRVVEENKALAYLEQLQMLNQLLSPSDAVTNTGGGKFSLSRLKLLITPLLELWKSSELSKEAQAKLTFSDVDAQRQDLTPMDVFFASELSLLRRLVVDLGSYFEDLRAVAEGTLPPTEALVEELGNCRVPSKWLDRMDGPKDVKLWLDLVLRRYHSVLALQKGSPSTGTQYDLTDFPRPQAFLNALRQHTASKCRIPLADLSLFCTLASNAVITRSLPFSVQVKGSSINIQGALMDQGMRLQPASSNLASSLTLPCDLVVGWATEASMQDGLLGNVLVPLYTAPDRQRFLLSLSIPHSTESDARAFSLNGVACFLVGM